MRKLIPILLMSQLIGCGAGDGTGLDENGQPVGEQPEPDPDPQELQATLTSIQENVLTPICAQCHVGNNAPLGLRMDDLDTSIANLIDVDAVTNSLFKRISPGGSAEQSFLFLKIMGDPQAGNQMPLGLPPLSQETIAVFRTWIENGAPIDAQQLIVTQSKVVVDENAHTLSVDLRFSQQINQVLFDKVNIELIAAAGIAKWPVNDSNMQLSWVTPKQLKVTGIPIDSEAEKFTILLNKNNTSSVFSQSGVWLDGDRDGIAGGEYIYEHRF